MGSKLSRNNLTDEIYQIVKEDILSHRFAAGEKINIDQLARDLEVSNIPIREALSRLQSEGYLHTVPFKGMFVNQMTVQELNEIYEIRLYLEPQAVKKAALNIPDSKLEWLHETMASLNSDQSSRENPGLEAIKKMNASIHGVILEYCDNANLKNLIKNYIEQIQRYLTFIKLNLDVDNTNAEWSEHNAILQKLLLRDSGGAAEAMADHIKKSHERNKMHFASMSSGKN
ncbi:GntR family transcriptional regulator [Paenibacillus sp. KQZ6P-2]|uniref:GntR family transcriptional regulator n=1 Tax=Paenibacillus mangrovi TaxID=2931978 RepID=A0A9X1WU39_9BACL|nr:GntR family transcriptional regulator [Paenibacillus mangrovi]MCJ8013618.1 GntR family transcriptional regulator [Paenibacillus mangrovi]